MGIPVTGTTLLRVKRKKRDESRYEMAGRGAQVDVLKTTRIHAG
jgi:hypothetical protein